MIVSMTGFGSAAEEQAGIQYAVEVRSVNNRFFKSVLKLPDALAAHEPEFEKLLRDAIGRGSIVLSVSVRETAAAGELKINQERLAAYVHIAEQLYETLGMNGLRKVTLDVPTDHSAVAFKLTKHALAAHAKMRRAEGKTLWDDLEKQLDVITARLDEVATQAPKVVQHYHETLHARVQQLVGEARLTLNADDLIREVALFADRADISEEIVRLRGHLEQFRAVCEGEEQAGRKLDFIAQEMLREANTIGSKANDGTIARLTVDIKSCIDRIKEQVQNVE
jgi:uncharacterized protein (TIGR00255 family)